MKTKAIATPENWRDLSPHPLSNLIEFGKGISVSAMAGHMKAHGYDEDEPCILFEGMILDGRHRHAACLMNDMSPPFREFCGKDALAYVCKKLLRQYPTVAERAKMAAQFANITHGTNQHMEDMSNDISSNGLPTMTIPEAAKTFGVSESSVARAKAESKQILCPGCATCIRKGQKVEPNCRDCKRLRAAARDDKKRQNNPDADVPEPDAKVEPMDDLGNKLPKRLRGAFAGNRETIDTVIKLLREGKRMLKGLGEWNPYIRENGTAELITKTVEDMKAGLPYAIHDACDGKGCADCRKTGWIPKWKHEELERAK